MRASIWATTSIGFSTKKNIMWTCQKCGVNLDEGVDLCGDCGAPVRWSSYGGQLQFSDPAWVQGWANGMRWVFAGVLCYIIILGLIILDEFTHLNFHRPGRATWLFGNFPRYSLPLPGIPATLMGLIGCWMVTRQDASKADIEGVLPARRLARIWMVTAFLWIALWTQLSVAVAFPMDHRFDEMLGVLLGLLAVIALLAYMRHIALRLTRTRLATATRLLKWGVIILLVPLLQAALAERNWSLLGDKWRVPLVWYAVFNLFGLIFVVWMAVLALRYSIHLHTAHCIALRREDRPETANGSSP